MSLDVELLISQAEGGLRHLALSYVREAAPDADPEDDVSKRSSDFVYSTEKEARDGHIIEAASWDLKEYRLCPAVLEDHWGEMIGRSIREEIVVKPGKLASRLEGTVEWDLETPRGQVVGGQHLRGFRRAVSVRWQPVKVTKRSELAEDHPAFHKGREIEDPWYGGKRLVVGNFYQGSKLLELSSAKIPSDPRALQTRAVGDGRDLVRDAARSTPAITDGAAGDELRAGLVELLARQAGDTGDAKLDAELARLVCRYLRTSPDIHQFLRGFLLANEPAAPTISPDEAFAAGVLHHLHSS